MTPLIAQIIGEDGKPKPFSPIDSNRVLNRGTKTLKLYLIKA